MADNMHIGDNVDGNSGAHYSNSSFGASELEGMLDIHFTCVNRPHSSFPIPIIITY